jgi:hypothetical protein
MLSPNILLSISVLTALIAVFLLTLALAAISRRNHIGIPLLVVAIFFFLAAAAVL